MGSLVACHRKRLIRLVKRILEIELDDEASRRLQFACFSGKGGYFLLALVLNSNGFSPRQRLLGLSHFGSLVSMGLGFMDFVFFSVLSSFFLLLLFLFHRKI